MIGFPKTATDFSHFEPCLFNKELKDCFEKQKEFYLNNPDFFSKKTEAWKYFPFKEWIHQKWDFSESKMPVEREAASSCLPSSLCISLQNGKLIPILFENSDDPSFPRKRESFQVTGKPKQDQYNSVLQATGLFLCSWKDFLTGKVRLDEEKTKKILLALKKQRDPFCSLSNIYGEGFILIVKEPLNQPLEIHYIQSDKSSFQTFNLRNFIFIEDKASARILEVFHGNKEKQSVFLNVQTDCFLSEKAFMEHTRLDQTNEKDILINQCFAELSPFSKTCFFSLSLNSQISRWHTELEQQEKSVSEIRGLSLLNGKKHTEHKVSVRHDGVEGASRQLYKSFLFDSAKQIFQGFVSIEKPAQKTDASQLSKNFLFGRGALAVAFPELDISADDVKAQHGATVSSFKENKDRLFYLQSRGLDSLQAFHLVLAGLIEDSLSCLQSDIKKALKPFITNKLTNLGSDLNDFFM